MKVGNPKIVLANGTAIENRLAESNLTVEEVVASSGLSLSTLYNYCNSTSAAPRRVQITKLQRLANVLNCHVNDFIFNATVVPFWDYSSKPREWEFVFQFETAAAELQSTLDGIYTIQTPAEYVADVHTSWTEKAKLINAPYSPRLFALATGHPELPQLTFTVADVVHGKRGQVRVSATGFLQQFDADESRLRIIAFTLVIKPVQ